MVNTPSPLTATYVDTPLGRLKFYTDFVGGKITNLKLAQVKIEPTLPTGMRVSACFAAFVEFSVIENVTEFQFHCDWEEFNVKGFGSTGEGLDAWEWEHNNHLVVVGTEDADWLNKRLQLPSFSPIDYPITMEENKMMIRLENLPEGHSYSLHFVTAWNTFPEPRQCSCWYAVDVPHTAIAQWFANAG